MSSVVAQGAPGYAIKDPMHCTSVFEMSLITVIRQHQFRPRMFLFSRVIFMLSYSLIENLAPHESGMLGKSHLFVS